MLTKRKGEEKKLDSIRNEKQEGVIHICFMEVFYVLKLHNGKKVHD
jgi:hypothetical protein